MALALLIAGNVAAAQAPVERSRKPDPNDQVKRSNTTLRSSSFQPERAGRKAGLFNHKMHFP